MSSDCIFCRIVAGELPAKVVHRGDGFVAIEDIAPKADTHLLVLPETHLETFKEVPGLSADEAKRMLGRTPDNITALRPMKDGVIADFEATEQMLRFFIQQVHRRRYLAKPRMVICRLATSCKARLTGGAG